MTSLVAYGSDSDDNSSEDEDFFGKEVHEDKESLKTAEERVDNDQKQPSDASEKPTTSSFFFSGDGSDQSDDSDDDESYSESKKKRRVGESVTELDSAFASSIFDNDYAREERMNARMLSRHVDLSEKPAEKERKKSKFTCKNYLKGKCRFGDKCRFSHPVHNRSSEAVNDVTISSEAKFYTTEAPEAQIFHSKKFKSSAGQ